MARLFRYDGTTQDVTPADGKVFTLEELYALIGDGCDFVEAIRLPSGRYLVMDEEAKLRKKPPPRNLNADLIALGVIQPGDHIIGNVLVVTPQEMGN